MRTQNYSNHRQIVYGYYITTGIPILVVLVLADRCMIAKEISQSQAMLLFILIGWILLMLLFRSRSFALKAQDRAIRAEENLRHYTLTGKLLDKKLTIGQIVALRFASDEELPSLALKAVADNLTNKQIKLLIQNWRADWYRV